MREHGTNNPRGQILVFVVLLLSVVATLVTVFAGTLLHHAAVQRQETDHALSLQLAESGIDHALWCLNHPSACPSFTGESQSLGAGSFTTALTDAGDDKRITATSTVNGVTRTFEAELTGAPSTSTIAFHYGVQVGVGGLSLASNARVNGNVFSNGTITGSSNALITGDASVAGGLTPAIDQQLTETQLAGGMNVADTAGHLDVAQSFVPGVSGALTQISVYVKKQGLPANATVRIAQDNGGAPATTGIGSATLTASGVTTNYAWVNLAIAAQPAVVAGTKYWIIIDTGSASATNHYIWGTDGRTTDAYASGGLSFSANWSAGVWTVAYAAGFGYDGLFKATVGGNTTQLRNLHVQNDARANTIFGSTIDHDAYFLTITSSTVSGTSHPGTPPPAQQPFAVTGAMVADWKNVASAGTPVTPPSGTYTPADGSTIGPGIIDGNLVIDGNNDVTLGGALWVKGNFTMSSNATLTLASSFGSAGSVIVVDHPTSPLASGKVNLSGNTRLNGSGTTGSYLLVVSTNTSMATGGSAAISIGSNVIASVLCAMNGSVDVSSNATVKEVTGQLVNLQSNATITYDTGLATGEFSTGPGGAWVLKPQSWKEVK